METHTLKEAYFRLAHITIHYIPTEDLWAFEEALEALTEKIQKEAKWKLELFPPEATIQHL